MTNTHKIFPAYYVRKTAVKSGRDPLRNNFQIEIGSLLRILSNEKIWHLVLVRVVRCGSAIRSDEVIEYAMRDFMIEVALAKAMYIITDVQDELGYPITPPDKDQTPEDERLLKMYRPSSPNTMEFYESNLRKRQDAAGRGSNIAMDSGGAGVHGNQDNELFVSGWAQGV